MNNQCVSELPEAKREYADSAPLNVSHMLTGDEIDEVLDAIDPK